MKTSSWPRVAVAAVLPFLLSLYLAMPALHPEPRQVSGTLSSTQACLGLCAEALSIGGISLVCKYSFSGVPASCDSRLRQAGPATAVYAQVPTVARLLGVSPAQGVLLQLQRDGQTVFKKSLSAHAWGAVYGDWLFHAVYWPFAGLVIWLWPQSAFSKRATWSD